MKTKSLILTVGLAVLLCVSACFVLFGCDNGNEETLPPVLTVEGVPTEGTVGRQIVLPAATAKDGDGTDISSYCRVTVTRLNEDGSDKDDMINGRPANVEQIFTPIGNELRDYKIIYYVRNDAGLRTEKVFAFKATADTEKPVMTFVLEDEFSDFDAEKGLTGQAGVDISLPRVTAVKSDGYDASSYALITIYTADENAKAVTSGLSAAEIQTVRLIPGEYTAVYTLTDASGNEADSLEFPLEIGYPDLSKNLLLDQGNFITGYDTRFNEYGELEIGKTPDGDQSDNPTSATMNLMKLHDETVAISFTAEPYTRGGNTLFDISFIGTKSRDRFVPDGTEGMWSPYFVLRITENGGVNFRVASIALGGSGTIFTEQKAYSGNLRDGKQHVVYIRFEFTDNEAVAKLWVDVTPDQPTSYEGKVVRGEEHADGQLPADIFDELKDSQTGAGWLCFGGAAMNGVNPDTGKYGGSIMRISGVAVYAAGTETFGVDILPPQMTFAERPAEKIIVDTQYKIPVPTLSDGTLKMQIQAPDGSVSQIESETYRFAQTGTYVLTYVATDAEGNISHESFTIVSHVEDNATPVITVNKEKLSLIAGESLIIPEATASDAVDGDVTASISVSLEGPYTVSNVKGSIAVMAAGEYELIYTVSDLAGNTAEERVAVTVETTFTDDTNYLEKIGGDSVTVATGNLIEYLPQYISGEKVSYYISFTQFSGVQIVQFNLRGSEHDSGDAKTWMSGMVMRMIGNQIEVSANKHDGYTFGSAENPFAKAVWCDREVLLEYRLSDVTINGEEYLKFELWINGEKIAMTPAQAASSDDNGDLILPVSVFGSVVPAENRSAGPIRVSAQNGYGGFTVTGIYVDKTFTDAEIPESPVEPLPEGILMSDLNLPAAAPVPDTSEVTLAGVQSTKLLDSVGGYTATFRMNIQSVGTLDSLVLTLSGTPTNEWGHSAGITLTYRADNAWCLTYGGRNDTFAARFWTPALELQKDYYFAVRVAYVPSAQDSRVLDKITVEFWFGESADALQPVAVLGTETYAFEIDAKKCDELGVAAISSQGIYAASPFAGTNYKVQVISVK